MASNNNAAPPAGDNDSVTSLGREKLPQSPDLEPLCLTDNPEPSTLPTTAETIRRIFNDSSLSPEEQDGFVESILAIVRRQPGDPNLYDHEEFEAESSASFRTLNEYLDEVVTAWTDRIRADYNDGISSHSGGGSVQQGTQHNEYAVQETSGITNTQEEQAINSGNEQDPAFEINSVGRTDSFVYSDREYFEILEQLEMQNEFAWLQGLSRDILPSHFALFKRCFAERILHCPDEEKESLERNLSAEHIAWLAKPLPEDSDIKIPEKELVWVVIWSVMKFAKLLLHAGGGAVKDNPHVREYTAIMIAVGWLANGDPLEYIHQAHKGGPEVYMSAEGWITSKESWVEGMMEKLGGSLDDARGAVEVGKDTKNAGLEGHGQKQDHDSAAIAAREELVKNIVEDALMSSTRDSNRWARYTEGKWLEGQVKGGFGTGSQGPPDTT